MNARWKRRPEGSNWGDYGPDDQLGRLNLITREKVLQGIAEVREGITFSLSMPLHYPGGNHLTVRRGPPTLRASQYQGTTYFVQPYGREVPGVTDVVCDDSVELSPQYSTQWDALAHMGSLFDADDDGKPEPVFYNGFRGGVEIVPHDPGRPSETGATRLGIEHMAVHGVQGRGVMIDLHHHYGDARRKIGYDDLMRVVERDGVEIETGDMVCLHTGFARMVTEMAGHPDAKALHGSCPVLDGQDERLKRWIADSNLAALIADNHAVEDRLRSVPEGYTGPLLGLHELCLFKLGIHLGELWYLTDLAHWLRANDRRRFLLTAPPLRLAHAVGSPVNPVATV